MIFALGLFLYSNAFWIKFYTYKIFLFVRALVFRLIKEVILTRTGHFEMCFSIEISARNHFPGCKLFNYLTHVTRTYFSELNDFRLNNFLKFVTCVVCPKFALLSVLKMNNLGIFWDFQKFVIYVVVAHLRVVFDG